jgi:nicotinamidase-related amidase
MDIKAGQIPASPYAWPHDASFSRETTALVIIDMQRDCTPPLPDHPLLPSHQITIHHHKTNTPSSPVCSPSGYLSQQNYPLAPILATIPRIRTLLHAFRAARHQVYHTREGHRPDLSTLSSREAFRSHHVPGSLGIGSPGPLGRLLVRGEPGHDIIPELYPVEGEPVIDKPGRGAFAHTDFELLLRVRGIRNLVVAGVTTDVCVGSTMREANDRGFDCLLVEDGTQAVEEGLRDATCRSVRMEGGIFGAVGRVEDVVRMLEGGVG